jgi:pSer/pThr/pTyr-binding forkhead associated (FHA) protein
MSATAVTLTVVNGPLAGQEYVFQDSALYVLGRARGCFPHVPDDARHKDVSRHHCLLGINPPEMWVQDLGSKNGTYVNGKKIGPGASPMLREGFGDLRPSARELLQDGDEVALGGNVILRVGVHALEETVV